MNKKNIFLIVIFIIAMCGCSGKHLINDKEYRNVVVGSFSQTEKLAHSRKDELFGVFNERLSRQQEDALTNLLQLMRSI